jgi:hypothetical protein
MRVGTWTKKIRARRKRTAYRIRPMEKATNIITALAAVGLFGVGAYLCWRTDSTAAATTALSFAFLVILMLHMSKFKHVKGFGFDAETWDEKQVEAAKLVDQLSSTSEVLSQQVALLASRVGGGRSALTNSELVDLLEQIAKTLGAASIPKSRRDEISAPIRRRIAMNYWIKARDRLSDILWGQVEEAMRPESPNPDMLSEVFEGQRQLAAISSPEMPHDLYPLIVFVKESKTIKRSPELLGELNDLDEDLRFFISNEENQIRRKIDLDVAYPTSGR